MKCNRGKKAGAPIFRLRRFDAVDSLHHVPLPANLSALNRAELEALLVELYGEVASLKQTVAELRCVFQSIVIANSSAS